MDGKPLNDSRLIVSDDVTFLWEGETITKRQLDEQFEQWRGYAVMPEIGSEWRAIERAALLATMYETVPFTLTTLPDTKFAVQFQSFPYTLDGRDAFQDYALHLIPVVGEVTSIELRGEANVAINRLRVTCTKLLADTGNGALRVEIYFKPTEVNAPLESSRSLKHSTTQELVAPTCV
jgi:hypothetical protein